jgi:hypothetical protein
MDATFWELIRGLPAPVKITGSLAIGSMILEWGLIMAEKDHWCALVNKITFFLGWSVLVSLYMTLWRGMGVAFVPMLKGIWP